MARARVDRFAGVHDPAAHRAARVDEAELQRAHLDYALAGANTFELDENNDRDGLFDFLKSYGLDTLAVIEAISAAVRPNGRPKRRSAARDT